MYSLLDINFIIVQRWTNFRKEKGGCNIKERSRKKITQRAESPLIIELSKQTASHIIWSSEDSILY